MTKLMLALGMAAAMLISEARCFDFPLDLGFQLGFTTSVIPGPEDTSRELGLGVKVDKILGDKRHSLTITGTITNFSGVSREGIAMHFAVTSYIGTGLSRGGAIVEPDSIPPGGTATFTAFISLDSEKPRYAMYAVTAQSPVLPAREVSCDAVVFLSPRSSVPALEPPEPAASDEDTREE